MFSVPGMWLIAILPVPDLIDKLLRIAKRSSGSLTVPLLLDSTIIGIGGVILGLAPLVVGYGLLMLAIVAMLTAQESYRVLFPYVGVWMGVGLYVSEFSEPIVRLDPAVELAFINIHVRLLRQER